MPGLLHAQDAPDPGHHLAAGPRRLSPSPAREGGRAGGRAGRHLVGGGVGGLVEVDDAVAHVVIERALERGVAVGDGGVVPRAHVQLVVVLEQQRSARGVELGHGGLGLDEVHVLVLLLRLLLQLLLLLLRLSWQVFLPGLYSHVRVSKRAAPALCELPRS